MRKEFFKLLQNEMRGNPNVYFLTGDLGYGLADNIFAEFPNHAYNCGASEQSMMDMAVGMAYEGKIPFVYSITTFLLYRPFETIRTYINHEKLFIVLVGSGRDKSYEIDGYSHDATDVPKILSTLKNINQYYPSKDEPILGILEDIFNKQSPAFISLLR